MRNELNEPRLDERMRAQQRSLITALREVLQHHRDAVLHAPTGAGKSTLLPLALLQEDLAAGKKILMLEPRRLAARAVAQRMAMLLHEPVGATVGYRMRLDTRVSSRTRIEVVTEGVLTRMLQEDPSLEAVAYLIFDEFHERSLAADLGLALALDAREQLDARFRIVIMSATLECERVAALLGDAAVASVPGRAFPVELHYTGAGAPVLPDAKHSLERLVAQAVHRAAGDIAGDILVFLPGTAEIRRVEALLHEGDGISDAVVLPLYGDMSAVSQDAVLTPAPAARRKVVLATNIAETSLTIPGVAAVVDAGLVRRSRFDPATGMSRLELVRISRAASDQRAGRAGRVSPGVCFRLWSEAAQARLAASTLPEIVETDLAALALELARWGTTDALDLRWLDAPPAPSLQQARLLLQRLDALDEQGRLTTLGRDMSRLPLHPRLAHMVLLSKDLNAVSTATQLAALLSERDLLRRGAIHGQRDPDIGTRLDLMRAERSAMPSEGYALQRAQRAAHSLAREIRIASDPLQAPRGLPLVADVGNAEARLAGALLSLAYPDRIGQRRSDGEGRYLLANGRGARFDAPTSLAREEFIVALELDDKEREARIHLAAPLARVHLEQLFATRLAEEHLFGWDAREEAVQARRVRRLDALLIDSSSSAPPGDERTLAVMLQGIAQMGLSVLPWEADSRALQARMEFVRKLRRPGLTDWPSSDDSALMATIGDWLGPHLQGVTRRSHLAHVPLLAALRARLSAAQTRALDTLAPRDVQVPSGSHIRIDYTDENSPCVSVRLQEIFGLQQTPHIGGGAVAVTFKLLSPAQRPVQITRDLAGFWRSSYVEVRKDMRGRYPRHHWPENPLEATPSRRSLKAPVRGPKR